MKKLMTLALLTLVTTAFAVPAVRVGPADGQGKYRLTAIGDVSLPAGVNGGAAVIAENLDDATNGLQRTNGGGVTWVRRGADGSFSGYYGHGWNASWEGARKTAVQVTLPGSENSSTFVFLDAAGNVQGRGAQADSAGNLLDAATVVRQLGAASAPTN